MKIDVTEYIRKKFSAFSLFTVLLCILPFGASTFPFPTFRSPPFILYKFFFINFSLIFMIRKLFCWCKSIWCRAFQFRWNQYESSNVKGWTRFHICYETLILETSSHPSVHLSVRIAAHKTMLKRDREGVRKRDEKI